MPILTLAQRAIARRYHLESGADEIHRVRCADGPTLSVKRFLPRRGAPTRRHPVLCVPGLGANSFNFDAPGRFGLARYFADAGFESFVVDLRGVGLSETHPDEWPAISFDDFCRRDLPAVLAHIRAKTGRPALAIGHSMGGLILYAHLGDAGAHLGHAPFPADVRAAIAIASPVGFPAGWKTLPALRPLRGLGDHVRGVRAGALGRLTAPFALRPLDVVSRVQCVRENVDPAYLRRLLHASAADIPRGVLLQFRDWIEADAFRSVDGSADYRAGLRHIAVPVLVVAGRRDRIAPLPAVLRATDHIDDVELLVCAPDRGFTCDYGHIDLVFGERAPDEIFPRLLAFLLRHDRDPVSRSRAPVHVH